MNRWWFALLSAWMLQTAGAQEPQFRLHDLGDRYESKAIHALVQDRGCMIWMGTAFGLARYDGTVIHPVAMTPADTAIEVTALFEDVSRQLWVGTSSGEIFYLDAARKVHALTLDEGHPRKPITAIRQDAGGQLWFATYGEGAYVYTGTRLYNFNVDDGLSGNDIYTMTTTPDGSVWLGTDNGISVCTFRKEEKEVRSLGLQDGLPDQIITSLYTDASENVWIGTFEHGVVCYDARQQKVVRRFDLPFRDEITSFAVFDEHELWIGTHAAGVWRVNTKGSRPRRVEGLQAFKGMQVESMLSDVEGNIWISTAQGMLLSAFRPFERLMAQVPEIQTLYCDRDDQVWVGTRDGLYKLEEQSMAITTLRSMLPDFSLNITDLQEDAYHNLWIGTLDKGLYVYSPATGHVKHIGSIIDKGGYTIMSMDVSKRFIWLATLEGVVTYPLDQNIMDRKQNGFHLLVDPWPSSLHFVFQVFVDSKDRVWFATDGNGVFCMDGERVEHYTGNDSIDLHTVYSVCEDHRGHIWLNTPEQGLMEFDGQNYRIVGVEQGLGNLQVSSLAVAGTGDVLITYPEGIDLMEPDRRHFMYFSDEIGLAGFEPGLNAVAKDSRGHVYIGGKDQIIKYHASANTLSIHPRTQVTRVSVFNQPIDFTRVHSFSYAQNFITIDYIGLWFTAPDKVKYLYQLEGYDLQWKESKDHSASYSHLRPGTYTFYVKASENNFFLDEPTASYTFTIGKPFWQTWWFVGGVVLAGISFLYWLIKSRELRSERQAMLKKEMIESQLSALKAQINPHFLFNSFNTLITIIDENSMHPEVAIEYVEKLSDFYRSILQYREQELITLEEEWELVQNFTYLLEKRYGQHLRLHMDPPPKDAFILPLTLQMLVENAVKHNVISERHPLDVFITIEDEAYVTVCNNNQPKSRPEPSTRFGLQSIMKRYQLLSERKVHVEKSEGMFCVKIPIIKKNKT